jgi:hypothetical protein
MQETYADIVRWELEYCTEVLVGEGVSCKWIVIS